LLYIGLNWLGRNYADVTDTIREFIRQIRIETIINRITFDGATTTQCSRLSGMRSSEWTATWRSDWMKIQKDAGPGRMSRTRGSASGSEVGRVLENSLLTGNLGGH
jgi:putative DNA-invertase from lambdoid prophage Rac